MVFGPTERLTRSGAGAWAALASGPLSWMGPMASGTVGFLCCSLLSRELDVALGRLGLSDAPRECFVSDCHAPSGAPGWPPARIEALLEGCSTVVALCMNCRRPGRGGGVSARSIASLDHPGLQLVAVQTHGELFMGPDATDRALTEGAFLVLPGWLERWRHILVDCWGFDEPTARAFFADSARRLLFLDTGSGREHEPRLEAMASFVGLPVETRYVGTSYLEVLIERALAWDAHRVERARAQGNLNQARAQAAEYAVVVDFLEGLGALPTPDAIVRSLVDVASMLFAPREARFLHVGELAPGEDDAGSFTVPVTYGETALGSLAVRDIALPEHRGRYLPLARAVADAAGIALHASTLLQRERELSRQLERKVAELDQFAYVASHDLQAPLRRTVSFVELLVRAHGDELTGRSRLYLEHIERNALLMRDLVQDLLRLSRAGNNPLRLAPLELGSCLQRALVALGGQIEESGASVRSGSLPVVVGDAGLLAQLFQNLIGNAIKFVPPGTTPVVSIDACLEGERWVVEVADNGIGIDPAHAAEIFQPFRRLHRAGEYEGTGIGLAVCAKVVERHGGRIEVEPGAAGGSVFRFTLPSTDPVDHPPQEHGS